MVDESGKKRAFILQSDGSFKKGDDMPTLDSEAPDIGTSAEPMTLQSMARYIRSLTTNPQTGNSFPVSDSQKTFSVSDPDGNPAAVKLGGREPDSVFDSLQLLSNLGVIGETFPPELLERIRDPKVGLHHILYDIVASKQGDSLNPSYNTSGKSTFDVPKGAGEIQQRISDVLKKNRFNPSSETPFVPDESRASTIDERPVGRAQLKLGQFTSSDDAVPGSAEISYEDMKKIGLALMLRAAGEFIERDGDPTNAAVGAAALLPGESQLAATRVNAASLRPRDLSPEQGVPEGISRDIDSTLNGAGNQASYGSLNTFLEPFGGFAPVGMIALGVALVLAVKLVIEGILLIFGSLIEDEPPERGSIYPLGSFNDPDRGRLAGGLVNLRDFGIRLVDHQYLAAVDRGIDVFFGFDGNDFVRVIKSPGYYATLVRSIIRSGNTVINSITDATSNSNPIGAAQGLLGVVNVISTSQIVAFINLVAQLGDRILTLEDSGFITVGADGDEANTGQRISTTSKLTLNAASRVMKSRESEGSPTLAWRTGATRMSLLLPASVKNASLIMQRDKGVIDAFGKMPNSTEIIEKRPTGADRAEFVADIENSLDAEYMPFYFHDLRTDEFVSFHAFLSEISDTYSPVWDESQGYGRVDPAMIYSSTTRNITLSFWIVSTNHEDFDIMWWKINKLVSLVYPQWSAGRSLNVGENTFIQPFSQVPTSSPIVRIRLGDVIRSNYSKFALARLFGLGRSENDFKLDTAAIDEQRLREQSERIKTEYQRIVTRMRNDPNSAPISDAAGFKPGEQAMIRTGVKIKFRLSKKSGAAGAAASLAGKAAANAGVKINNRGDEVIKQITAPVAVKIEERSQRDKSIDGQNVKVINYRATLLTPIDGFSSGPYDFSHHQLEIDETYVSSVAREKAGISNPEQLTPDQQAVENFFDSRENVVVRSFESTTGRGLAGVIKNLSFDWHKPTWEIDYGRRGPQWCQVSLAFQPIHDIAPGLDSDGFNRAPVYGVGKIARSVSDDPHGSAADKEAEDNWLNQHSLLTKQLKRKG